MAFNEDAQNKLYNPIMIFNYFNEVIKTKGKVKDLVDYNLKTDYGRLQNIIERFDNKQKLRELIENNKVDASVVKQFSIETISVIGRLESLCPIGGGLSVAHAPFLL